MNAVCHLVSDGMQTSVSHMKAPSRPPHLYALFILLFTFFFIGAKGQCINTDRGRDIQYIEIDRGKGLQAKIHLPVGFAYSLYVSRCSSFLLHSKDMWVRLIAPRSPPRLNWAAPECLRSVPPPCPDLAAWIGDLTLLVTPQSSWSQVFVGQPSITACCEIVTKYNL